MQQQMNWNEALTHFGIDYQVNKQPVYSVVDGETQEVPGVCCMVRGDTNEIMAGVSISDTYSVLQASHWADVGERITGKLNAEFVKGGTLKGGRVVYLQAKLPDSIRVKGTDDVIDKMLTFVNSYDGSSAFMILPSTLRIFCANQMNALRRDTRNGGVSIRHTRNADARLADADKSLLEVMNAYREYEEKVNWLTEQKFTDEMMTKALQKVFNIKAKAGGTEADISTVTVRKMTKIRDLFESGQGIAPWKGSGWAAANAFSEWSDHHRSFHKSNGVVSLEEKRQESSLIGNGAAFKDRSLAAIEEVLMAA